MKKPFVVHSGGFVKTNAHYIKPIISPPDEDQTNIGQKHLKDDTVNTNERSISTANHNKTDWGRREQKTIMKAFSISMSSFSVEENVFSGPCQTSISNCTVYQLLKLALNPICIHRSFYPKISLFVWPCEEMQCRNCMHDTSVWMFPISRPNSTHTPCHSPGEWHWMNLLESGTIE